MSVLVTGSEGLIGRNLCPALRSVGCEVKRLDKRLPVGSPGRGDVLDMHLAHERIKDCTGIIHLAGVSRVAWGEHDPDLCWSTNVWGTKAIVTAALESPHRPWFLYVSSSQVYGEPESLPVSEDFPLRPVNVYGQATAHAESIVFAARGMGVRMGVVRLSNAYGDVHDYPDRVMPAFARHAAQGTPLEVCGSGHSFDFLHVEDAVRGLVAAAQALEGGERRLPPLNLLSGHATTLGKLAALANAAGSARSKIIAAPVREHDVSYFAGDARQARKVLGWRANVMVESGIRRLVRDFTGVLHGASRGLTTE